LTVQSLSEDIIGQIAETKESAADAGDVVAECM